MKDRFDDDDDYIKSPSHDCDKDGTRTVSNPANYIAMGPGGKYFRPFGSIKVDKDGKPLDCFIATAVYGDTFHPQVIALRNIRDDHWSKSLVGRCVIGSYYSGLGRKVAGIIQEQAPSLVPVCKRALDAMIAVYAHLYDGIRDSR